MATKRQRVARTWERPASDAMYAYLQTGRKSEMELFVTAPENIREGWLTVRDGLLEEWIASHPGTRPWAWWQYDAPELERVRLTGTGDDYSVLGGAQSYSFGVPDYWLDRDLVEYYRRTGRFPHDGIDPDDPPTFESQATYLERHALFVPGERRRLTAAHFEPEAIAA
jgi:hypothetical protein